ncbi:MAG: 16S rRNA (cytosine(1402)-N(4))-methyltransferase RsmH [Bacteroidetes bacterium]|nr:16S rRNA (cytosine(1402)-N(4))-methyltransferase RsmH [Bacteroidota bacterium]
MERKSTADASDPSYHVPVLLREVVEGLNIKPDGIYVDCTLGGGGHGRAILERLGPQGRLIAFDQDADAVKNLPVDSRVAFWPQNFRHLRRFLRLQGIEQVDGVLADLGVSSHQFDEAGRGFSIRFEGPLDMRMDQRESRTAAEVIARYSEADLHRMFEQYGEVTNARTLARLLVQQRTHVSIETTQTLKDVIREIVKGNPSKYFAQVFQALRMEVNQEVLVLKEWLEQLPAVLSPGARAAVITFHSIEDRLVKQFFRRGSFQDPDPNPFTRTEDCSPFNVITKKPIEPTEEEKQINPRSRSAKLRIAERR